MTLTIFVFMNGIINAIMGLTFPDTGLSLAGLKGELSLAVAGNLDNQTAFPGSIGKVIELYLIYDTPCN